MSFESPKILKAPYKETPDGEIIEWKQEVNVDFGKNLDGY